MTLEMEGRRAEGGAAAEALARFETTPHGVLVVAPDLTIQFADPFSRDLFGYADGELVGRPLIQVLPSSDIRLASPEVGQPPRLSQLRGRDRDGTALDLEVAIARGGSPDGDLLVAVREVASPTARQEHERRAYLVKVLGRFASRTCHDLKNHLMALTGYTELALGRLERDPEKARQMLGQVLEASDRVLAYVDRIHALGRGKPEGVEPYELTNLLGEIEPRLRAEAPPNIRLVFDVADTECWAQIEPERLFQGLRTLIENAAEASEDGAEVLVKAGTTVVRTTEALPDLPPGSYMAIEVADQGSGMDPDTRSHLFEPFLVDGRDRDRGLGMATLYAFCRKLGGGIVVDTYPGRGTTIRVLFPRCERPDPAWLGRHRSGGTTRAEGLPPQGTVLVVDDVAGVRDIAREALEEAGYRVIVAADGAEALTIAGSEVANDLSLLLTDVLMPGMSGPELAMTFAERFPQVPVLFMSAYSREPLPARIAGRPVPFLAKPFTPKELASKVSSTLAKAH